MRLVLQREVEAREDVVLHNRHGSWAEFLMFSEGPVVSSFERTQLTLVGRESSVLVLVVNGLLTVPEHSTTSFAGVAAFFPMDMFLVLVENNVGDESFVTFITRLPDAHVYGLYVLLQGKFAFPEVANEFFRTKLADNLSLRTATKKIQNQKCNFSRSRPPYLCICLMWSWKEYGVWYFLFLSCLISVQRLQTIGSGKALSWNFLMC